MGRGRKYAAKTLRETVDRYFKSITREIKLTEKRDTGRKDGYGHKIFEESPILNQLEEQATLTEYLVPPTIGGMCRYLGVETSTWSRWCDANKYPQYKDIVEDVYDRLLTWKNEQVLLRKDVKGLIWDLEVNHGCGKRQENSGPVAVILEGEMDDYAG